MPHLLDTCVLIDVLRGRSAAVSFCQSINQVAISVVSVQELFAGARDNEITQIEQLVSSVEILPVNSAIARLSGEYLQCYFRSHGMDSNDAFIAATANIQHYNLHTLMGWAHPISKDRSNAQKTPGFCC